MAKRTGEVSTRLAFVVEVPEAAAVETVFSTERGPLLLTEFLQYHTAWLSEEAGVLTPEQRAELGVSVIDPASLTVDQQRDALRYEIHAYLIAPYNLMQLNAELEQTKDGYQPVVD